MHAGRVIESFLCDLKTGFQPVLISIPCADMSDEKFDTTLSDCTRSLIISATEVSN